MALDKCVVVVNDNDNVNGLQAPPAQDARFHLDSERLGPLPLVNAFLQRMGLEGLLDKYVPTTDRRNALSHAQALGVLLRSIIVEREPVYRQQETVCGFAPGLFGVSVPAMERLGDDRIGRALDRLFDADRAALLTEVVVTVGQRFGVSFDRLHTLYPEQRECRRPTTEQVLRLFSLAQRHRLTQSGHTVQLFDAELTDLQRQVLDLLDIPESAYRALA